MKLPKRDLRLYYRLHQALLFRVHQWMKKADAASTVGEFMCLPLDDKVEARNALCDNLEFIDRFVEENPFGFSAEELEIVGGWKNLVRGEFFLMRYLKKHAIFLSQARPFYAYGVLALGDTFEEMVGPQLPRYLAAVLLPFKGQIVYDGMVTTHGISFGRGLRQSLNDAYQEAKAKYGIICSLPFSPKELEESDANTLKFYLQSQRNREWFAQEIKDLIDKDPSLLALYHQQMGGIHARQYRKKLRNIGVTSAWFAVLESVIVAVGTTKPEVERIVQEIVPAEKAGFVHVFRLGRRQPRPLG